MIKKLSVLTAASLLALGAHAAVITQNFGVAQHVTELDPAEDFGVFNMFDPNQGTLTGATLSVNGSAVFTFDARNTANQGQRANLTASTSLFFSSDLAALDALLSPILIDMSHSTGILSYAVGETKSFGPINDAGSDSLDLSSILGALTGSGTFQLQCETLSGFNVVGGGGNIATSQQTQAGCGAELVYTYDEAPPPNEAPEPGALALLGLALAGAGAATRRRRKDS